MKKYQFIFGSTLAFIVLFYNQWVGFNLGIFGLIVLGMLGYKHSLWSQKDKVVRVLTATSFLSCFAFAYYGDFLSFLALFSSFVLLQFHLEKPSLNILLSVPMTIINALATSVRVFLFRDYLPLQNLKNDLLKKIISYVIIPVVLLSLFVLVYANSSSLISELFLGYEWDLNIFQLIFVCIFGFYFSFGYWNFWTPEVIINFNSQLKDDFCDESSERNSFLGIDFERKSGEISLFLLIALILVFIGSFTYEQFFDPSAGGNLSAETHERINSVIVSMVMAIAVVLVYFRSAFSFEKSGQRLRVLAQTWIVLNVCLMLTAFIKNAEYVAEFGLTYKRLGVFAFLLLVFFGLWYSFRKIKNQKTNTYLLNRMFWYFYALILICGFINWGNLITRYNIAVGKGVEPEFLQRLNFNDEVKDSYFEANNIENVWVDYRAKENEKAPSLSKIFYYEFLKK